MEFELFLPACVPFNDDPSSLLVFGLRDVVHAVLVVTALLGQVNQHATSVLASCLDQLGDLLRKLVGPNACLIIPTHRTLVDLPRATLA